MNAVAASQALRAFVGLTNTRLEVYRWAAENLSDPDLSEVFIALYQQARTFKQQLAEVVENTETVHPLGDGLSTLQAASALPPKSADVYALFDLLDQLNEAETHAMAQLKADALLQQTIRAQRDATHTLHEALDYLRQYA